MSFLAFTLNNDDNDDNNNNIRGLIEDDKCRLSNTSCQDVKTWQDQNMSNATTIHSTLNLK